MDKDKSNEISVGDVVRELRNGAKLFSVFDKAVEMASFFSEYEKKEKALLKRVKELTESNVALYEEHAAVLAGLDDKKKELEDLSKEVISMRETAEKEAEDIKKEARKEGKVLVDKAKEKVKVFEAKAAALVKNNKGLEQEKAEAEKMIRDLKKQKEELKDNLLSMFK